MNSRLNFLKVCPLVSIADHGLVGSYTCVNEITLDHFA